MSNCYCRWEGGTASPILLEKCRNCIRHDAEMELLQKAIKLMEKILQPAIVIPSPVDIYGKIEIPKEILEEATRDPEGFIERAKKKLQEGLRKLNERI